MKNITMLAVALMGMTVSSCSDKKTKMTKTLNTECARVIAVMDKGLPENFCACLSEQASAALEPDELIEIVTMFTNAKNERDLESSSKNFDEPLASKIEDIVETCED